MLEKLMEIWGFFTAISLKISELEYGVFENDLAPIVLSFLGQPKVHPSAEAVTSLLVTKRCMRFNLVNGIKTTRPLHAYELFHSLFFFFFLDVHSRFETQFCPQTYICRYKFDYYSKIIHVQSLTELYTTPLQNNKPLWPEYPRAFGKLQMAQMLLYL